MNLLDFKINIANYKAKKSSKRVSNHNNPSNVIFSNVTGVIWIDENKNYYVKTDKGNYYLTDSSYKLKDGKDIYKKDLYEDKVLCIKTDIEKNSKRNDEDYLPFCVGAKVKGSIIKQEEKELFNITLVITYKNQRYDKEAIEYYKKINEY